MLASDAERSETLRVLNTAFAAGQLTNVEHALRIARALGAVDANELVTLTEDLHDDQPARGSKNRSRRMVLLLGILVAVAAIGALRVADLLDGTSVGRRTMNVVLSPVSQIETTCQRIIAYHRSYPGLALQSVAPTTPPPLPHNLVPQAPVSAREDLAAFNVGNNAEDAIQGITNMTQGYQGSAITIECLNAYDPSFRWLPPTSTSVGPTAVSLKLTANFELLAIRSESGTCWFRLTFANSVPAAMVRTLGIPSNTFGVADSDLTATSDGSRCAAADSPGIGHWTGFNDPDDYVPQPLLQWTARYYQPAGTAP